MADPQPADQGFLPGLLGKVGGWFGSYDPQAAYGGLLSDPATQQAFRIRELGAAAQAMAQASMPVPYKGGMPWGSFLGSAGGAAATAGDSLIKARLEQAQAQLAGYQGQLAEANVHALGMNNQLYPVALGMEKGAPGTGTGTDGKLTGPQKIIASQSGKQVSSTTADPSLPPEARALLDTISGPESGGAYNVRWGGPGGDKTFDSYAAHPNIPEPGPQGDSTAAGRYQIVNKTWKPLQAKYGFGDFTPVTQDQAGWHLAADTYKEQTGRDLLTDLQAGKTDQVASALHGQWSTLHMGNYAANLGKYQGGGASPQTASTGDQPAAAPGSQVGPYAPVPGQPGPQGVYVPPGASPNAPPVRIEGGPPAPAVPPGGLLKLPDPTSAAPPQLATPPAAGAPGPVTGLLGQQPAQQVAAADAPQLSPAAAAILQGINRQQAGGGLLASGSVAGGNAVPTGGPSPAAVAQAGPPHTGAAGAAELAGLLAQQPPPQAPAAGPVPPSAAPAPAGPMPPAPGGAAPPMPPPPPQMPPQMPPPPASSGPIPGAPTDRQIAAASIIAHNNIMMGKAVPPDIAAILNYKYAGPTAAATAGSTSAAQLPYQQQQQAYQQQLQDYYKAQEQYRQYLIDVGKAGPIAGATKASEQPYVLQQQGSKAMWDLFIQQNKPEAIRPGSILWNPQTQTGTANWEAQGSDGAMHQFMGTLDLNGKILQQTQLGISKPSALTTAGQTGIAQKNADTYEQVQKEAASANEARTQATFMRQEAPNFYTGVGAAYNQDLNKVLLAMNPDNPDRANKVASYETFIKDAGILVRSQAQAASQGGAGVQELKLIGSQMPSEDTSQRGLDRVLAQIQGLSDYRLVKQTAQDQYVNQPGRGGWDNNGFEAQFNKNISPYTFMYMRMSDQDKQGIRDELSKTKAGQSELQRLSDQIGYINQNGLRP
jgi:muramidase (phage lysozyme)